MFVFALHLIASTILIDRSLLFETFERAVDFNSVGLSLADSFCCVACFRFNAIWRKYLSDVRNESRSSPSTIMASARIVIIELS